MGKRKPMTMTTDPLKLSPIITARCVVCGYVLYFDERTVTYRHQAPDNFIDPWFAQQCPAYGKEYRVTIPGLVIEDVTTSDKPCDNNTEDITTNG